MRDIYSHQEHHLPPTEPPTQIRRVATHRRNWGLRRTFTGYRATSGVAAGGKAPKWILIRDQDASDFFLAKLGYKNGEIEVLTELFNNQLGAALGFDMAHSGIARLGSQLHFISKSFRRADEQLVHGSLMIENFFNATGATATVSFKEEQRFYAVDFLEGVIKEYCQLDAPLVFERFIAMLVFDALIGSMDRHAQNWGILVRLSEPVERRFTPIFDSARALMWNFPLSRLKDYCNGKLSLSTYVHQAKPCIGPPSGHPKTGACNHFDLVRALMNHYPSETASALCKIPENTDRLAHGLLNDFPFRSRFHPLRKSLIVKILKLRADNLIHIYQGGQ